MVYLVKTPVFEVLEFLEVFIVFGVFEIYKEVLGVSEVLGVLEET